MNLRTTSLTVILLALIICEFFADYIVIWKFSRNYSDQSVETGVRTMIVADTHLIGPIRGHWLDKLYREWHMRQSFQAAIKLLKPEIVFILGDLFDEGEFVDDIQFQSYIERFNYLFKTPNNIPVLSVAGNHDIGFHYKLFEENTNRFTKVFNNSGVEMYTIKNVHFVMINSMAMQNDKCHFCKAAMKDIHRISSVLTCLKKGSNCNEPDIVRIHKEYSRPILMQHFPTFRISDTVCKEGDNPIIKKFRENWEVLSKESTDLIGKLVIPRVAFAGHSHHYCLSINRLGIEEYTVASFNWRNKISPSFLMAKFNSSSYTVSKCDMLSQNTVFIIYLTAIGVTIFFFIMKSFISSYILKREQELNVKYK